MPIPLTTLFANLSPIFHSRAALQLEPGSAPPNRRGLSDPRENDPNGLRWTASYGSGSPVSGEIGARRRGAYSNDACAGYEITSADPHIWLDGIQLENVRCYSRS